VSHQQSVHAPQYFYFDAPRRNDVSPTGRSNVNGCRDLGAGIRKVGVAAATTSSSAYFPPCGGKASGNIISRGRPRRPDDKSDDESATFSCRRQWFAFARVLALSLSLSLSLSLALSLSLSLSFSLSPTFHGRLSSTVQTPVLIRCRCRPSRQRTRARSCESERRPSV